ncbi:hypothetical protein OG612_11375 [Streptomyces sp. NBC_01527]|uniref:hypothetical protein n=1 Tax=unclassified Streptomyces TaxID=2593676 RepID=UPI0004C70229|nr:MULTISPECIES: hypothetical protein [unclassified Streptomyces]WSQ30097.1 hypothetical protein OG763_32250 [Streptomyces sp. NBC_01230]
MAIFVHATLSGVTADQYDALHRELQALPEDPFAGCLSQVCTVTRSGVELFDLWESPEAAERFGAVMLPIAEKLGLPMTSGPPKMSQTHRYRVPGA